MKLRPGTSASVDDVRAALYALRRARNLLKRADCPQTLQRVRLALTSCGGALRHAERRAWAAGRASFKVGEGQS